MAISKLPKLRGLVGVALIGALVFVLLLAPTGARAQDTGSVAAGSVPSTPQGAVPSGATAAIPENPAAAVPAAATAAVPSSASAAVPAGADGPTIASHVLAAANAQPSAPAGSGSGSTTAADPPAPDPSPVTAGQAVPTGAQKVAAQAQNAPATPPQASPATPPQAAPAPATGATIIAPKAPKPDGPGISSARGGRKTSTSGFSTATGAPQPQAPRPASVSAPAVVRTSVALGPAVSHSALRAPHAMADVHRRASAERRSRSPRPVVAHVSAPTGGLVPATGSLPPAGAGASGIGAGVGAPAAMLLTLVALCLLGTLLPGLLGLEVGPWTSALYALRLERPG